jgi:hypothetical protein
MRNENNIYIVIFFSLAIALIFVSLFDWIAPLNNQYGEALIVIAVCILILSLMLASNLLDERPRPVHLLFCLYMIFFYLLPGFFHLVYGQFPFFNAGYVPGRVLRATIVIFVFLLCTVVGYRIDFPTRRGAPRSIVPSNLRKAILFCAAAAVIAATLYGFGSLLATRGEESDVITSPSRLVIGAIARSCSFYAFMFAIFNFRSQKDLSGIGMLLSTAAIFMIFNSPLSIPRFMLASYIIVMFFVFLKVTKLQKLALALALVASQGTLFSYISYISRGAQGTEFNLSPIDYYMTSGDFDGLQSTINVIEMHDEEGGKGGVNILSAVFFFVPREVWPQKSIGTGGEGAMFEGYPFINISSPLPSEFYVDFGMAGVIALSLLFGLFVRLCDDYFMHFKNTSDSIGQIFVCTVAGYIFIILRGSLVGTLGPVALSLFIAGICHRYSTAPSPHPGGKKTSRAMTGDKVRSYK